MQPLLRHASRPILDSVSTIRYSSSIRSLSTKSSSRPSTCIQCQLRVQRRHFADNTKPASPSATTPANSIPSISNGVPPSSQNNAELPSTVEGRRSPASKSISDLMDNLQSNIFLASQRLNDLTGYSGIEALKQRIMTLEENLSQCQETVRCARDTYKEAVANRAASQREVTTLLARKDSWTPVDLERFTSLYRSDHSNEAAVQEAQHKLGEAERLVEQASNKLSTSILARYHEEQIWSDKIRRMSTWGTWGLMGVNVVIFLVFQFGFEPWRRRRLVTGFEEKVQEALKREKESLVSAREKGQVKQGKSEEDGARLSAVISSGMEELESECDDSPESDAPAVGALAAVISNDAKEESREAEAAPKPSPAFGLDIHKWKADLSDLFSDRITSLRKKDVTIIALEGAATGAGIVGLIMFVIRPH